MADAAAVLGILGVFALPVIASIPAVICGLIAQRQIDRSGGVQQGRGLATTGVVLGVSVLILYPLAVYTYITTHGP